MKNKTNKHALQWWFWMNSDKQSAVLVVRKVKKNTSVVNFMFLLIDINERILVLVIMS